MSRRPVSYANHLWYSCCFCCFPGLNSTDTSESDETSILGRGEYGEGQYGATGTSRRNTASRPNQFDSSGDQSQYGATGTSGRNTAPRQDQSDFSGDQSQYGATGTSGRNTAPRQDQSDSSGDQITSIDGRKTYKYLTIREINGKNIDGVYQAIAKRYNDYLDRLDELNKALLAFMNLNPDKTIRYIYSNMDSRPSECPTFTIERSLEASFDHMRELCARNRCVIQVVSLRNGSGFDLDVKAIEVLDDELNFAVNTFKSIGQSTKRILDYAPIISSTLKRRFGLRLDGLGADQNETEPSGVENYTHNLDSREEPLRVVLEIQEFTRKVMDLFSNSQVR